MLWLPKQNELIHFLVPWGHIHITNNEHLVILGKKSVLYYEREKQQFTAEDLLLHSSTFYRASKET